MKQIDLLKLFYERTDKMIRRIVNINTFMLDNHDTFFKSTNMGNRNANVTGRFVVENIGTSFNITNGTDFNVEFGAYQSKNGFSTQFCTNDYKAQIQLGFLFPDSFTVRSNDYGSDMKYPIQEEQYFQNLTMMDLSSEEVYEFFMGKRYEFTTYLQLTTESEAGLEVFENFLNSSEDLYGVLRTLLLVSNAYCTTNGINI